MIIVHFCRFSSRITLSYPFYLLGDHQKPLRSRFLFSWPSSIRRKNPPSMVPCCHVFTIPKRSPAELPSAWKAKCPIFKAIVAGFRGKVAKKNRTLGVPGMFFWVEKMARFDLLRKLAPCISEIGMLILVVPNFRQTFAGPSLSTNFFGKLFDHSKIINSWKTSCC